MQQSAFVAHCPYEIGDKVNIMFYEGVVVVGGPITDKTVEVVITDILAIHSCKRQQVSFMYEIDNAKVLPLMKWEEVKHGK